MEAWNKDIYLSWRKEDKKLFSKEVIRLDHLYLYSFNDYVTPSAEVLFIHYYDPSPFSWEGSDQ